MGTVGERAGGRKKRGGLDRVPARRTQAPTGSGKNRSAKPEITDELRFEVAWKGREVIMGQEDLFKRIFIFEGGGITTPGDGKTKGGNLKRKRKRKHLPKVKSCKYFRKEGSER